MTKKDLFRLIIKIFGLFSIITTIFSALPSNISWVIMEIDLTGFIWIIGVLIIIILLFVFLIFKPDKIIGWLKLDKGFDSDMIEFQNFNAENILKLAVIVIGGIVLLKNIPAFLSHTLFAFKSSIPTGMNDNRIIKYEDFQDYFYWLTSAINVLIGYLMLTNYEFLSKILKNKTDND